LNDILLEFAALEGVGEVVERVVLGDIGFGTGIVMTERVELAVGAHGCAGGIRIFVYKGVQGRLYWLISSPVALGSGAVEGGM